jgi:hypothetical protein
MGVLRFWHLVVCCVVTTVLVGSVLVAVAMNRRGR